MTKCEFCGKPLDDENTHYMNETTMCEDCLEEHYTVGTALAIGDADRTDVEINSFIARVLNPDRINHILEKWVEENFVDGCTDIRDFLNYNKDYFSEWVANEASK